MTYVQPSPSSRPGHMTAVMRAIARPTGSKSLRAALVRGGRVIDERILPRGTHLTVGPTERSTFVITSLARSERLLEWAQGGYRLQPVRGATGRVAFDKEAVDLADLGRTGPIVLGDSARGKIAIGDTMVLFHFVDPVVPVSRPALPLAVKEGLLGNPDWKTTIIAAFSFLFHFGALGAVYSDWGDEVVDEGARIAGVVQSLHDLPSPPPLEQHDQQATNTETGKTGEAQKPITGTAKGTGKSTGGGKPTGGGGAGGRMSDARAHDLADQLAGSDRTMLIAIGGHGGSSTATVMAAGDMPTSILDNAAASAGGTRTTGVAGLNMGGSGGVVQPGRRGGGLPGTDPGPATNLQDTGKKAEVKPVNAGVTTAPPEMPGGKIPHAGATVAGMKALLRACYKRALDENPNAQGSVRVTAKIGPNGDVTSAQAGVSGTLPSSMGSCVSRVVKGAQFEAPEGGGGATVVIPLSFFAQ